MNIHELERRYMRAVQRIGHVGSDLYDLRIALEGHDMTQRSVGGEPINLSDAIHRGEQSCDNAYSEGKAMLAEIREAIRQRDENGVAR